MGGKYMYLVPLTCIRIIKVKGGHHVACTLFGGFDRLAGYIKIYHGSRHGSSIISMDMQCSYDTTSMDRLTQ